jgi:AAA15 family ATPase/GTPase
MIKQVQGNNVTLNVTMTEQQLIDAAYQRRLELDRKIKNVQARSGSVKSSSGIMFTAGKLISKGHMRYNCK